MIKLLVVEDERAIRDLIRFSLPVKEFYMEEADSVHEAEIKLAQQIPDLILVDWMLPGRSGIEFVKWLRQRSHLQDIPVIMLTAKAEEENKIRGLETGADDYVTKPFSPTELVARIKTVLRRGRIVNIANELKVAKLILNKDKQEVYIETKKIDLRPIEYKLLLFFMSHTNKTYDREHLLHWIWGGDTNIDDRTVDVHIRRLRNQLKPFGYHNYIKTIRGSGYQFKVESDG